MFRRRARHTKRLSRIDEESERTLDDEESNLADEVTTTTTTTPTTTTSITRTTTRKITTTASFAKHSGAKRSKRLREDMRQTMLVKNSTDNHTIMPGQNQQEELLEQASQKDEASQQEEPSHDMSRDKKSSRLRQDMRQTMLVKNNTRHTIVPAGQHDQQQQFQNNEAPQKDGTPKDEPSHIPGDNSSKRFRQDMRQTMLVKNSTNQTIVSEQQHQQHGHEASQTEKASQNNEEASQTDVSPLKDRTLQTEESSYDDQTKGHDNTTVLLPTTEEPTCTECMPSRPAREKKAWGSKLFSFFRRGVKRVKPMKYARIFGYQRKESRHESC